MPKIVTPFKFIIKKIKNPFKRARLFIKHRLGWLDKPHLLAYRSFGNDEQIIIKGAVMEDKGLAKPEKDTSLWQNILAMIKRYSSDEIPNVRIKVKFNGQAKTVTADENGIFEAKFDIQQNQLNKTEWHAYEIELLDEVVPDQEKIIEKGEALIVQTPSEFGIISDVDDTFLVSHATDTLKKLRLMLFKNALTRFPFEGVAAFYRALHKGVEGKYFNPIFYVSSSEWNLYDLLIDFCYFHRIPKGPFLLHELKVSIFKFWKSGGGNHDHKLQKIRFILNTYKKLKFILIGDSGQKDAEIYTKITREFPDRIKSIYIRDVSSKKRILRLNEFAEIVKQYNVEMVFVKNTQEAAEHAIKKGFLDEKYLTEVRREKESEEQMPGEVEQVVEIAKKNN